MNTIPTSNRFYFGGYQLYTSDNKTLLYAEEPIFVDSPEDIIHTTQEGDTFSSLAFTYYNNSKWAFLIALRNDVAEGFEELPKSLTIPSLTKFISING